MRYLILFMLLAGIFVLGNRKCAGDGFNFSFGGIRGEGPVQTQTRTASDFHAVAVEIPADVELRIAEQYSMEVQAQENILPVLKTEVENGKLRLYFDENVSQTKDLKVRISAPAIDDLAIAGSGNLKAATPIRGEQLKLSIGGSGDILVPGAELSTLHCSIAGSGKIRVTGTANEANFEIAGSGDIDAKELAAQNSKADIAGSGSVHCNVAQNLKVNIAGSGDVFYSGNAAVDMDVSGSGKVKKTN